FGGPSAPCGVRRERRVGVDDEVIGLVRPPREVVVPDLVLAVVGDVGGLRRDGCRKREDRRQGAGYEVNGAAPHAVAHVTSPADVKPAVVGKFLQSRKCTATVRRPQTAGRSAPSKGHAWHTGLRGAPKPAPAMAG